MAEAEAVGITSARIEEMQLDENVRNDGVDISVLQLSEKESQILDLYDRLEEIMMETCLLQAQDAQSTVSVESEIISQKDFEEAQKALLEAKARHALRNNIVESVLIANPILKAIHAGSNASPIERDLRPLIEERDQLSILLTETTAKVLSTTENLTKLEAEHIIVARQNAELAARMIALAEEANFQKKLDIQDPTVRAQLDDLEESVKISRQRWRIMKGTASAVVAGSGVDWARDAALRELVLEPEDE